MRGTLCVLAAAFAASLKLREESGLGGGRCKAQTSGSAEEFPLIAPPVHRPLDSSIRALVRRPRDGGLVKVGGK